MIQRIVAYRTKHFEFRVPVDEWNEKKIPLPEGAGAQFIAPSDLTAILLEPFYYDWSYETDGQMTDGPTLVYDEEWVGKEIRHFPWCKELLEFLNWLKKEHGWYIIASWIPFYKATVRYFGNIGAILKANHAFRTYYNLELSGFVQNGNLMEAGKWGHFRSASELSAAGKADNLHISSCYVTYDECYHSHRARSVRCVSDVIWHSGP